MIRRFTEAEVVARVEGLTVTRLRAFVAAECVAPQERDGRPAYSEADLARLHLVHELFEGFDLDPDAVGLVMSLLDQVHGLRRELRTLAAAVDAEPHDVRDRIRVAHRRAAGR